MIYQEYKGNESHVVIPECVNNEPVSVIGDKAFCGCREVFSITLPETVTHIGDWAFANMKQLSLVTLPGSTVTFGKKVFMNCSSLRGVQIKGMACDSERERDALGCLLRNYLTKFTVPESLEGAAFTTREGILEWLKRYDEALDQYLMAADTADYQPEFFGWFDVEDLDDQEIRYIEEKKQEKVALAMERAVYAPDSSTLCRQYLLDHQKIALMQAEDVEALKVLKELSILTPEEALSVLERLDEQKAEERAFLLALTQTEEKEDNDFFAGLEF